MTTTSALAHATCFDGSATSTDAVGFPPNAPGSRQPSPSAGYGGGHVEKASTSSANGIHRSDVSLDPADPADRHDRQHRRRGLPVVAEPTRPARRLGRWIGARRADGRTAVAVAAACGVDNATRTGVGRGDVSGPAGDGRSANRHRARPRPKPRGASRSTAVIVRPVTRSRRTTVRGSITCPAGASTTAPSPCAATPARRPPPPTATAPPRRETVASVRRPVVSRPADADDDRRVKRGRRDVR